MTIRTIVSVSGGGNLLAVVALAVLMTAERRVASDAEWIALGVLLALNALFAAHWWRMTR